MTFVSDTLTFPVECPLFSFCPYHRQVAQHVTRINEDAFVAPSPFLKSQANEMLFKSPSVIHLLHRKTTNNKNLFKMRCAYYAYVISYERFPRNSTAFAK